jgi:hypothetical protein
MGFFNDLATTVSDTQIKDYLTTNPNLTGQQLADAMKTYNVTPEQLVRAVGAGPDTAANVAGTFYQPQYASTGSGETFQQGPLSGLTTYSEAANKPGGGYNVFDPTGKFTGTGTQQKVSNNMLPFLLATGGMMFGLPGLGEAGAAGAGAAGTAGMTAAELAQLDLALGGAGGTLGAETLANALATGATVPTLTNLTGGSGVLTGAAAGITADSVAKKLAADALISGAVGAGAGALTGAGAAGAAGAGAAGAAGAGAGSTLTSLLTPAAIAASGLVGASTAKSAAETQAESAREANALLYKMYQEQKGLQEPFRGAGITAQNRLLDLLGLSQNKGAEGYGRYAKDFGMSDFTADPGYAFRLAEGQKTLDRQAAARGGLISGGALKAATRYGQDMGSQEYQSAFNRYQTNRANQLNPLGSLLTSGQAAASNQAAAAGNYGTQAGGNITGAGAATAAGQVGSANALTNALSSYLNYSSGQNLADAIRKSTYGG